MLADRNQSFVRLLGVELGPEGAPCQRFAGVVDGGILLKLVRLACPAGPLLLCRGDEAQDMRTQCVLGFG